MGIRINYSHCLCTGWREEGKEGAVTEGGWGRRKRKEEKKQNNPHRFFCEMGKNKSLNCPPSAYRGW